MIREKDGKWRTITDPNDPDYERAIYIKDLKWFKHYKLDEELSRFEEPNLSMTEYKAKMWEMEHCTNGL